MQKMPLITLVFRINGILEEGWYGKKRIDLRLPECEENPETFLIVVNLRNVSNIESEVGLKRKQICSCPMKQVQNSFNITKSVYDCPHREILKLKLSDNKFYVSYVCIKNYSIVINIIPREHLIVSRLILDDI